VTLGRNAIVALCSALAAAWPVRMSVAAESIQAPSARTVELVVIGSEDRQIWLEDLLGPHSAPGATLSISRTDHFEPSDVLGAAAGANTTLYCWVDLRLATRARVYFSARAGKRFLLRDVELSGAFDALDRESLSQVLASSWSALFEDEQVGLSREETQALLAKRAEVAPVATTHPPGSNPSPSPDINGARPTPKPSAFAARIGAFYAIQAFSGQLWVVHGPGLELSAGSENSRRGLARIGVRLESVATRVGVELRWPLETGVESAQNTQHELGVRAGLGADFTHLSPQPGSADASAALTPARWTTELVLTGGFGASTRLTRNAALGLRLFIDVLPRLAVYELAAAGGSDTLLSPWHVRPGLALELETR
jgi:hypothetical protein